MGNNNSHQGAHHPVEVVRRPPSRPLDPPSARPLSSLGPQGPSYHSPENLVLPKELPSNIRLRPVSMELSKFNPEYEQMFSYKSIEGFGDNNNELKGIDLDPVNVAQSPTRPPPPMQNGHIPSPQTPPSPQDNTDSKPVANNVKSSSHIPYKPSHRRQMSLTNNLTGHTIVEEPEEDIDSRIKLDPLMQSFPGATGPSLPVKNTSNLDYSYQLTYAQLAEARRNKTLENLEKKTGKKLSDLSADLTSHSDKPSFERGTPGRTSSKSLGSAISTKKKKAPTPPGVPPPPPTASSMPNSPRSPPVSRSHLPYSVDNEPPIDYDMESPRKAETTMLPRYNMKAQVSSVKPNQRSSVHSKTPVPPPPPNFMSKNVPPNKAVNLSRNNSLSSGKPELVLRKAPSVNKTPKPVENDSKGEVPWLLEIKTKSEARAARQQSMESLKSTESAGLVQVKKLTDEETNILNDMDQAIDAISAKDITDSVIQEALQDKANEETKVNTKPVERSNSLKEAAKPGSPKLQRHFSTTAYDKQSAPVMQRQTSAPAASTDAVRRLNSLLQHDIKAAANAKCVKLVKQTTPVKPKPKDPHTVFREQLEKACAARDERVKVEGTIDDNLKKTDDSKGKVLDDDEDRMVKDKMSDRDSERDTSSVSSREPPEVLPKPPRYHKNVTLNKQASNYTSKPRHIRSITNDQANSNNRVSTQSMDWTPENDLDSDDNLSDREHLTQRKLDTDGFKSTIIPGSVTDLKSKKGKGKQKKLKEPSPAGDEQGKSKIGSVKKFKKSMHRSVKNAFGSISKASGKILRKQRSEEFEVVEDAPKNWTFTNETQKTMNGDIGRSSKLNRQLSYNDESSDSDSERQVEDFDVSEAFFRQNGDDQSDEETPEEEENMNSSQTIKRAGVAYINQDGKLVVIPDSGSKSRKNAKQMEKEKYSYEASLKKKEKALGKAARASEEMARKQEEERRKLIERELELTKLREAETRERLHRLENAQMQQQLNAQLLQQQQHQSMTMLSAPPLPSSGPYPSTLASTAHTQAYTTLFGQQVPHTTFPNNYGLYPQNGPILQSSLPYDLNDYMRMMGIQNPPTTQQMAYFLNNMTLTGQPFDLGSSPNLFSNNLVSPENLKQYPNGTIGYQTLDSSVRKQNFQNWASSPNLNTTNVNSNSVPLADFVSEYNGATSKTDKDKKTKGRNPLYNSDDSDEGLSPQRTVTCGMVSEYRSLPKRTESGKFMKQYGENYKTLPDGENYKTLPARTESGKFMKQFGGDFKKSECGDTREYHIVRVGNSATDIGLNRDVKSTHRQRSVSPSNSSSTVDSAITSAESTLSTPPSPSQSNSGVPPSPGAAARAANGYRTVLDLTSPNGSAKILTEDGSQDGH